MARFYRGLAVAAFAALISGCYVAPPYSYVRGTTYAGSAYYGSGPTVIYRDNGYYGYPYSPAYYGCCWAPGVTVGGVWYRHDGGRRYYRGNAWHGQGHWRGNGGDRGHRNGHRDGDHRH